MVSTLGAGAAEHAVVSESATRWPGITGLILPANGQTAYSAGFPSLGWV